MKPETDDPTVIEPPTPRMLLATDADGTPEGAGPAPTVVEPTRPVDTSWGGPSWNPALASTARGGTAGRGVVGKIEPGQLLYGKYHVLRKLGGGAMGDVWLVRHGVLKSQHALKVIIPNIATNQVALMRFQREFEVMASLRHEHAVTIYDASIDEEGGYIDMEYVEGQTFHEILGTARSRADLDPSGPLIPLDWIVRVLDQLCEVLHVAHGKGIVHRDLKPSNLMLLGGRPPGREYLKVLDFGIAKIRDDPENVVNRGLDQAELRTQGFIGTPSFGSPEQGMLSEEIDGRADLYSAGVMLYEFVVGRLPFRGNHWQVMSQHASMPPPSFAEANPALRPMPEVERAIGHALMKDRDQRPQCARDLFEEFREAVLATLPPGAPGLTPPSWEVVPFYAPGMPGASALPTEHGDPSRPDRAAISTQDPTLVASASPTNLAGPAPPTRAEYPPIHEDGPPGARPWLRAIAAAGVLVATGTAGLLAWNFRSPAKDGTIAAADPGDRGGGRRMGFEDYWLGNYAAVEGSVDDRARPRRVRRSPDDVEFIRIAPGIYLPDGFEADESADLASDNWPRVIVRKGVRFLRIPGGKDWMMGNWAPSLSSDRGDTPAHPVRLSGFYMQETEVTNGQFADFLEAPDRIPPREWKASFGELADQVTPEVARKHPAINVPRKLASLFGSEMSGALPTEAQWEYAARSCGQKRRFAWGDAPRASRDRANVDRGDGRSTQPVGSFPIDRTEQGLLDMTGNVMEMCRDVWGDYVGGRLAVVDPCRAARESDDRPEYVIRGASFDATPDLCSSTRRDDHRSEDEVAGNVGFRLVIECPDVRKPR